MDTNLIPAGTIAVGVDGSPSSERALTWAVEQAVADHRALTLVHAVGPVGAVWMDQAGYDTRIGLRAMQTHSQELLAKAHEEVEGKAPGLAVHEMLRVADPRNLLLEVSRKSAMVVIGSRGRGPVRSLLLGSVGVAVTRHGECPIVVVRPGNPGLVRRGVLVGVDGTERSLLPLEFAFRQASQRQLPLTVLHAFYDVRATVTSPHLVLERGADLEEKRLLLAETISGMREKYPDVPVTTELALGLADECMVKMAERMNLVVVGSHHGGAAAEFLFGSVPATVVEHATCPVAVVPTGGHR